jgi:DNA-binding NarL/FixJ family response regulator
METKMASLSDLSPRELEILQFVIAGKANKAIAREMYISQKTVEFHLENIYTKIGVRTRLMAGVWAIRQGLQAETRVFPSPKA